jgi:DNA-binding NtrC family response regulator
MEEVGQLREELRQYVAAEESLESEPISANRLEKLENDYPEIREARKSSLLGSSPLWEKVFENAVLGARGEIPVLIVGESGTGKTELARTIGDLSGRPREKYCEISCSQFDLRRGHGARVAQYAARRPAGAPGGM